MSGCRNSGSYTDKECEEWKNLNYCQEQYPKFMKDHCKKTCGIANECTSSAGIDV